MVADAYESSLYRARIGDSDQQVADYFAEFTEQLAGHYEELPANRFPHLKASASSSAWTC